ncbi:Phosphatidylglycerophosphatase A [Fibrobacter sp. UWP2]|nr:Phosphatidylglycerophosphatase A [Fibrobacter sp. UWP2]
MESRCGIGGDVEFFNAVNPGVVRRADDSDGEIEFALGIHSFEKFPGAWGVMADDLLGGVYAGIVLLIGLAAFGILP